MASGPGLGDPRRDVVRLPPSSPVSAAPASPQLAGHRLGNINPALYTLGALSQIRNDPFQTGIVDVTTGSNSYGSKVAGYPAAGRATTWPAAGARSTPTASSAP